MIIVVIEDSETQKLYAKNLISQALQTADVKVVESWAHASIFLQQADLVIADWCLGGYDTGDFDALDVLDGADIPYFIWTANPSAVNEQYRERVIEKGDTEGFLEAIRNLI